MIYFEKSYIFALYFKNNFITMENFKFLKPVVHVVLISAIFVLAFLIVKSIQKPLSFNAEQKRRYEVTIQRLKDIRTAQVAFRSEYKRYTGCFDTLIDYLKTGEFKVVRIIGDLDDSATVASGKIFRDTVVVSVLDSLFKKGYPVDSLRYVPFPKGVNFDERPELRNSQFELGINNITAGNVTVNVFEAKVPNNVLLFDLDPQLLYNFNVDRELKTRYAGLRVGSLEETTNNAGNWE